MALIAGDQQNIHKTLVHGQKEKVRKQEVQSQKASLKTKWRGFRGELIFQNLIGTLFITPCR